MTHEHESRSHRSSAVVFPNEPESDRGSFLNFMEESGANAVLTDAFRALYDCPEKPDAPLQWLRTYFRHRAPSRKDEIKEIKESLKRELLELQSSIFAMQEEAERKEELIKVLQGAKGEANYEPTSPLPERDEYYAEGNENLRSETRWRLQPDPFARASCSAEEVLAAKEQESVRPPDSSTIKTDSIMPPEDDFEDEHTLTFLTTADEEDDDEEEAESATSREEEEEEDNQDVNYKDEAWLKAYNVYKKTSQLPASDLKNPTTTIPDPALGSSSNILITEKSKSKTTSKVRLQEGAPHPDAFPPDYWAPGFNLLIESHQSSDSDSDSAMLDHDNDDLARTQSQLFYKASRGNSRYVLRPQRDQVIYENEWDLWFSLERGSGGISGTYSSSVSKNDNRPPKSSKVVHGPEFKSSGANEITEDEEEDEMPLPSTNSVQLGSSMRNLFDVVGGKSMHDPQD